MLQVAGQWFALMNVQIAVAVFVAILGIVNTLTVSIADRRRELAVLRAIGAARRQIRRTIFIEALSITGIGLVLGALLGSVNLYYLLQVVQRDVIGMRLDYRFPLTTVAELVPATREIEVPVTSYTTEAKTATRTVMQCVTVTEMVAQNYTVQVPYTEAVSVPVAAPVGYYGGYSPVNEVCR